MRTLILNSTNVSPSQTNKYSFKFLGSGVSFEKGDTIALASINVLYSWYNITSLLGNNRFSYHIKNNDVGYEVLIPDGFYSISDLNAILQFTLLANGHYLVQTTGTTTINWYPLAISTNSTYYSIQLTCNPIAVTLPTGFTNPGGKFYNTITFTVPTTPQFVISNTEFQQIIGVNAGTYPPVSQTTIYNTLSTFTPQVSPVQNIIVRCNLCNNTFANPSDILYTFTPQNVDFGSNIFIQNPTLSMIDIKAGNFQSIDIELVDQNYNKIVMKDTNVCIQLVINSATQ